MRISHDWTTKWCVVTDWYGWPLLRILDFVFNSVITIIFNLKYHPIN
jgi:hypothetical protein